MGEKKSGDLPLMKAQIRWKGPAISESRKPKTEQHLHSNLKYHHAKTKDFKQLAVSLFHSLLLDLCSTTSQP